MPLSYQNYTGDNVTTTFNIPFTYTATSEISVTVDGVAQTGLTFPSASQVQLTSAPASSTVVQVRRTTDLTSRAVDFASGSVLTEEDLDNSNIQIFHSSQEAVDLTDDTIQEDVDSKWDAESKVIKNVANPTNAQDAATKDYLENTWLTPADKAQLNSLNTTNLNTVATNIADVNAVAADATDIGTVSTNIASVNTVATNIADVVTVANDLNEAISEIETAADDLNEAVSDIDTVSTNIANVNTVGGNISNVNTVAGINSNVTTVAGISGNVTTVAGISGNVTSVAGNATNINTVAGNTANINTVATNNSDISTVSSISSDVSTVAGITSNIASVVSNEANINTVAGINGNVTTVANNNANVTTTATNIANINSVAGNSGNINAVVANETNINSVNSNSTNINTVATNISNVNSVGGSIANVNTVATNLASVNNFAEVYRIESSAPTTSLDVGDLYFDTTSDTLKVYGTSGWQNAGSSINGTSQRYHYDITGTPTSVTGADANGNTLAYDAGYVDVYVNGVRMSTADVTVTSGDTVTFTEALANGDEVDIVGYGTFSVASLNADNLDSGTVPDARITGAYTGITNLTMSGDLTVDTNTLYVDSANNRVGIGETSPLGKLHIRSSDASITSVNANSDDLIVENNGNCGISIASSTSGEGNLNFIDSGDTNIGRIQYTHSNNEMNFRVNDVERMRIDSSGNVAIGHTSTGGSTFAICDGANSAIQFFPEISTDTNLIQHYDQTATAYMNAEHRANSHEFKIGTSNAVKIDSSGNLGIGETSPLGKLHIKEGDSGVSSVSTDADQLVIENNAEAGISILAPTNSASRIAFGDSDNNKIGMIYYNHSSNFMKFDVNNSERMRIDSSGRVGIGASSPASLLHLKSSGSDVRLQLTNSASADDTTGSGASFQLNNDDLYINAVENSGNIIFRTDGGTGGFVERMRIDSNGLLKSVPTNNNATGSGANMVVFSDGQFARSTSSLRYKNTVNDATHGLTELLTLRPVTYKGNNDGDTVFGGLIAEEVHDAGLTEFVTYNDDGEPDALAYGNMVSLCIKAIQELKTELDEAKARIVTLENA